MNLTPWRNKQKDEDRANESPLAVLRTEMDRLFDSFVREPLASFEWPFGGPADWAPAIDVAEDDKHFTVRAEVPGIDPDDVEVTVSGNQLVLSGEKKESRQRSGKDYHVRESCYGAFRRVIPLPNGVDADRVEAQCANGVLTINIPKSQVAPAKRIEVKVQDG